MSELPKEIHALAIGRRIPTEPFFPKVAAELCRLAGRQCGPDRDWWPIRRYFPTRDAQQRGAYLRYAGGQSFAVGRLRRLGASTSVYYVAIDGEVLQHQGRPVLFLSPGRAMRAATLAATSTCLQRLCDVIGSVLAKPVSDIDDRDVGAFDEAVRALRGAIQITAIDWPNRPIEVPMSLRQPLTTKGPRTIVELTNAALNIELTRETPRWLN